MASTGAVAVRVSNVNGLSHRKKPSLLSFPPGNLSLNANPVGKHYKSFSGTWKSSSRSLCVRGLFVGKDKNEKSNDEPSKAGILGNMQNLYQTVKKAQMVVQVEAVRVQKELAAAEFDGYCEETNLASKFRGVSFYAITAIAAIFLFVLMLIQHPFVLLLDRYQRKAQYFIAKIWAWLTVAPFFRIKYEGLENLPSPGSPAVYVSNHQSFLDIYTLLTLGRSFKFISKTGIFLFPIIGWAMFMLGVIPLKRMDSRSQLECLKQCIEQVKKGASVFFFPEGTRSKDGKLGTFKKGAFSVAAKTRVPIVPITLVGTGKIMPSGMEGILNFGSVRVVIHKPVEGSDPEVLCNEVRNTIADVLEQQS